MSSDYFEGVRFKSGVTATTMDAATRINYQNLTKSYAHKVTYDIDQKFGAKTLSYALSAGVDYRLNSVVRPESTSGSLIIVYDNSFTDNRTLSLSSADITQSLYTKLHDEFMDKKTSYSSYRSIKSVDLQIDITTD